MSKPTGNCNPSRRLWLATRVALRLEPFPQPRSVWFATSALGNRECMTILAESHEKWRLLLDQVARRDAEAFGKLADEMLTAFIELESAIRTCAGCCVDKLAKFLSASTAIRKI